MNTKKRYTAPLISVKAIEVICPLLLTSDPVEEVKQTETYTKSTGFWDECYNN